MNFALAIFRVTACLLHNESASYLRSKVKPPGVAVAKASLNRAIELRGVDPKPSDLSMAR